jgi:hypothetical protein
MTQTFADRHDADLTTVGTDQANLIAGDLLVYPFPGHYLSGTCSSPCSPDYKNLLLTGNEKGETEMASPASQ